MIGRDRRVSQGRVNQERRDDELRLGIARDHLTVFAQEGPADHAAGAGQPPPAMSAAFTLCQIRSGLPAVLAAVPKVEAFRRNPPV